MTTERNTMEEIEWEEPPPAKSRAYPKGVYVDIAKALRQNPGKWAIVRRDGQGNLAIFIRRGQVKGFAPAGSFEAVSRANGLGRGHATIYARYVGVTE
jgi:hypothetical protein